MNKSIQTVSLNTSNDRVRDLTRQLYANAGHRVRVTFTKKYGGVRVMDFVPRNQYNEVMGITSTDSGKKVVAAKAKKDMIVVSEIYNTERGDLAQRPRTINLRSVIGNIVPVVC